VDYTDSALSETVDETLQKMGVPADLL